MSHISNGDQLTSREVNLIGALDALTPDATKAIAKSGSTAFTQISAGGGSGAMEVLGGTIDGSNVNFTANNLPVWIEVGGQVMVSQATDSTNYGFTVTGSSAPYAIAFVTAPQAANPSLGITAQTPHSFHN